ncbi:taste receptor type 2 member 13-like [Leptodactylus fuscus]|uniref:taste receptor type 2 member 13-like n=1 Tax=Leptodactylus fuscus TaxID=238119 RepID=UPI003F4F11FA
MQIRRRRQKITRETNKLFCIQVHGLIQSLSSCTNHLLVQSKKRLVEKKTMNDQVILLISMLVSIVAGVLGVGSNSWIVYVNLKDWRSGFRLSVPDRILGFMALVNAMMQIAVCFDLSSLATGYYDSFNTIHLKITGFLIFLVSSNLWFTTWLSIFYYLRIVNFTSGLLMVLKMRISTHLPKLMVVSTAAAFIIALQSFWNIYPKNGDKTIGNAAYNSTKEKNEIVITLPYVITVFLMCVVPLILTLLPIALTLCSLRTHMKRMTMNEVKSSQTQAHITATRTMVLLVTAHTGFYVASIYLMMNSFNFVDYFMVCCSYFIIFYPIIQAFVMITGNSKLKKAIGGLWRHGCAMRSSGE